MSKRFFAVERMVSFEGDQLVAIYDTERAAADYARRQANKTNEIYSVSEWRGSNLIGAVAIDRRVQS